jgi:hypothetical protein
MDSYKPKDNYNFVYWSMFFLGILCLLPWDIAVTVSAYWQFKFRNATSVSSDEDNSRLGKYSSYYLFF